VNQNLYYLQKDELLSIHQQALSRQIVNVGTQLYVVFPINNKPGVAIAWPISRACANIDVFNDQLMLEEWREIGHAIAPLLHNTYNIILFPRYNE
jgi:hypothetical protein